MLTETATEFDAGPLTWVQGEIDESLARAGEALARFRAHPADTAFLKHARAYTHQAAGAIQMVGLDGVVAFTDEIERQLVRLEELPAADVPATVDIVDRAINRLRVFLDEIGDGTAPVPLALAREYEAMRRARGEANPSPSDLFYPDLGIRPPRAAPGEIMPAARLASHLLKARRQYQRGLLEWLRGARSGAQAMREALEDIEAVTAQPNLRAFWWTAAALLEGLELQALEPSFAVKQLVARIDLQIRRVTEGSAKVADRLRREVLYCIAVAAPTAPQVETVQRTYRLATLIPAPATFDVDAVRIRPLVREAREHLASAKESWLKAAAGRGDNAQKLAQLLAATHANARSIGEVSLVKLTSALVDRLAAMPAQGVSEPLAMEFATALLLAESAFENFNKLSPDLAEQVDSMLARLDAAQAGHAPGDGAPALDEMSQRAQERVLLGQVIREVQANLRHMEQVLDAFFRDHSRRQDLASLARDSQQIRGALRMLELDDADRLLALCQAQIESYADPATQVDEDGLELLAESLSGLGFYLDAVLHQRPDRDRIIAPLVAKRLGETPQVAIAEPPSVEDSVAELRATLPRLIADVRAAPADAAARAELRAKLVSLRDDADLIGDADLVAQVKAALREIDEGTQDQALAARVGVIAESGAAPAPELSEETRRLLATDASALDAELLDIYLAEADEVLDAIAEHLGVLEHAPGDRDALVTIRRQFHTLKGSGRMVGLSELGELAWAVERVHNRLLEEERRVTPALLVLVRVAEASFRSWVHELRDTGRFATDASPLLAAIHAVEAEFPADAHATTAKPSIVVPHVPPAPPVDTHAPDEGAQVSSTHADDDLLRALERDDVAEAFAPDLELVTFPELGAPVADDDAPSVTVIEESFGETIDVGLPFEARDAGKPILRVVADNTSTLAHDARARATHPDLTLLTETPRAPAAASADDADEVMVGDARLSSSLWRILCDEAEQHVALLQHEVAALQFDPDQARIEPMTRASHTLCGIHRTANLALVATTARALEQALLALEECGTPFPGVTQPVLARATAGLAHFVARIKAREAFTPNDAREAAEIDGELDELRHEALANVPPSDPLIPAEEGSDHLELVADEPDVDVASAQESIESVVDGAPILDVRPTPFVPEPDAPLLLGYRDIATIDDVVPVDEIAPIDEIAVVDEIALVEETAIVDDIAAVDETAVVDDIAAVEETAVVDDIVAVEETAVVDDIAVRDEPAEWTPPSETATAPVVSAPTEESLLDVVDDLDASILPIFLEEAAELFPQAGELLRGWRRDPGDATAGAQLRRSLHTLKGSARMAGAMRLGELAHRMEARLSIGDQPVAAGDELFEALDTDLDRISFVLDALREGRGNVPLPWLAPVPAPAAGPAPADTDEAAPAPEIAAPATPETPEIPTVPERRATDRGEPPEAGRGMLRVRADIVDQLVNEAGEVAIARARVEGELRALKTNLLELTSSVIRLRNQVREIELAAETQIQSRMSVVDPSQQDFDPLELDRYTRFQELTRSLAEGVNDVSTVQQSLLRNLDDANAALLAQARLSRDVQQRLFAIRTVPFSSLSERLYRVLRTTARELDKRANLEIQGGRTELDRSVLEKLVGPLEHLLRNALDHGIESREARLAAGKSETGEIALTVRQVGNEVTVELADDGAGIDFERVAARAHASGLVAENAEPTIHQLVECLFQPGFSTASEVTQISGRGIGMDVVRNEIAALGGRIDVHTTPGKGTRFNLFLPLTLAVAQAVLVRAGGRMWAVPAAMVEQVQQVKADVLRSLYADGRVQWQGRAWPFHYLPRLLADTASVPQFVRYNAVLLIRSGQGAVAIHVDEMLGNQEVVVKNIGAQLARVSGISGATVLGTGEIVLIIHPVQLAQRADVVRYDPNADERFDAGAVSAPIAVARPLVMVVDDSLTVRKFTTRLLSREGFEVVTARDGIDALKVLSDQTPGVILLDIEMPRMDGFEFAKTIKGDAKLRDIPIVMITSRTADKHRNRAMELGVDRFLGKPYQEEELLGAIGALIETKDQR